MTEWDSQEEKILNAYNLQRLKYPHLKPLLRSMLNAMWRTRWGWQEKHLYDYFMSLYKTEISK